MLFLRNLISHFFPKNFLLHPSIRTETAVRILAKCLWVEISQHLLSVNLSGLKDKEPNNEEAKTAIRADMANEIEYLLSEGTIGNRKKFAPRILPF